MPEIDDNLFQSSFYRKAITEAFTSEEEEKFLFFKKMAPLAKKLKIKAKDRAKFKVNSDLFTFGNSSGDILLPEEETFSADSELIDKDFAFQLAYEMEDLKSLKWYEHIVDRCDRLKERQLLLRAKGEVIELMYTSDEPKNKGLYFSRLVRKYAEERGISMADYSSRFNVKNNLLEKRDIIKRKRKDVNKLVAEIKDTLSVDELCHYHKLAMEIIGRECGKFFYDHNIDIPTYVVESYVNKVIAKDYGFSIPARPKIPPAGRSK